MKFYYQVVTTPTADTPGSAVVLNFPDKRYLFGQVAEGTQRACAGTSVKFGLMTDIFLTGRLEMNNVGGLFGVILTLADGLASAAANFSVKHKKTENEERKQKQDRAQAGKGDELPIRPGSRRVAQRGTLTIHGGRNLTHLMATARKFIFRKGLPMYMQEHDGDSLAGQRGSPPDPYEQPTWSDQNIKVWVMAVSPESHSRSKDKRTRKRSHEEFREQDTAEVEEKSAAALADQVIRQNVVSNMFNSTWTLDALQESKLADVQMPAVIFVRDPETKDLRRYTGPVPGGSMSLPDITVLVRKPWPGANVERIPPASWNEDAISYIVRNHNIRGKFDPLKAQALKVRKGPDYAQLTKGESVLSEDGQTITPDMVLDEEKVGKGVAIIDLPSPAYVENLVNRPEWDSPTASLNLEAFIWILGPGVGDHPKLRKFVAKMSHCTHTVSSPDYCPDYLAMKEVAESTAQMAMVRPDNYALPVYDNVTVPQSRLFNEAVVPSNKRAPLRPLEPGMIINMEPTFGVDESEVTPLYDPRNAKEQLPKDVQTRMKVISGQEETPEFQDKLAAFRQDLPGADVEIITLGTGSSIPSKHRNVSSTLVHAPGNGYYLLDCGEGTLGQLKRVFGPAALREVFQNMRMIWISHLHADHHLGIANVIKAWYQANYPNGVSRTDVIEQDMSTILRDKRLFVVCDQMMTTWLEEYASVEDYGFQKVTALSAIPQQVRGGTFETSFEYRHCRANGTFPGQIEAGSRPKTTTLRFQDDSDPLSALLREAIGLSDILPCRVQHCRGSMAVTLVYPDDFKLSFSGDCRPSGNFAATGRGSTVLIHEATFQNDMAGSAIAKKHSTYAEALEVARQMQARALLLTHFSQRYQGNVAMKNDHTSQKVKGGPGSNSSANLRTKDVPDDEEGLAEEGNPQLEGANEDTGGVITATPRTQYNGPYVNAFDYMRVRVGDFPILQAYVPAMEKLFAILEEASAASGEKAQQQRATKKQNSKSKLANKNTEKTGKVRNSGNTKKNEGKERFEKAASRSPKASTSSAADKVEMVAEVGTAQEDGNHGIIKRVGWSVAHAVSRAPTAPTLSANKIRIKVNVQRAEMASIWAAAARDSAKGYSHAADLAAQASAAAAKKIETDVHGSIERAEKAAETAKEAEEAANAAKRAATRAAEASASSADEMELAVSASIERAERAAERAEKAAERAERAAGRVARRAAKASSLPPDESDEDRNAKRAIWAEKRAARRAARASASASSADEMEVDTDAGKPRRSRSPKSATSRRASRTSASSADEMAVDTEAGKVRRSRSPNRATTPKRAGKASASPASEETDQDAKKPRARSRSRSRASES
ncbi:hypothetical protein BP00DRAFT_426958 [Aspergillus indologenus CBS 114.80]|uniref:ribonuclease Z n=1 Tax=Aspergillus indologenus CBS 114.80 TaxID=1450541 RepID=A0A2V5I730_9EURO|nr:hypothetical protein BP00DRAFT_426958 [Aspergillus indologenus CBS 114.80]